MKLVLCSFFVRAEALRVISLVSFRATCCELLAESETLKPTVVEMLTGPYPPEAVTPRLKPLECWIWEFDDCDSSFFSVTPSSLYASR